MKIRLRQITAAFAAAFVVSCGGDTTAPDNTVASVSVTGVQAIAPGASTQFTAIPRNAGGSALTGFTATWSSSSNAVATVSATGLVTGVANGTATITATVSNKPGTRQVTVQTITPVAAANVAVQGSAFSPTQVDITSGGSVTWTFQDVIEHNVTFETAGAPSNTGNQSSGATATRTFTTAGTYPYHCSIHSSMQGTVVVH